jgi:hypothetical protein
MGLTVKSTDSKKIHVQGTSIELPSVYVRFEYVSRQDGKTLELALYTYLSKEAYNNSLEAFSEFDAPIHSNPYLPTDIEKLSILKKVEETIDLVMAHNVIKDEFESEGYDVEIDENIL